MAYASPGQGPLTSRATDFKFSRSRQIGLSLLALVQMGWQAVMHPSAVGAVCEQGCGEPVGVAARRVRPV
ncbi:MAG: hypothetical protein ABIW79_05755 [Gemmatimonas sp.]